MASFGLWKCSPTNTASRVWGLRLGIRVTVGDLLTSRALHRKPEDQGLGLYSAVAAHSPPETCVHAAPA
jgi:hypothetical protein